jgi:hypothetical protein
MRTGLLISLLLLCSAGCGLLPSQGKPVARKSGQMTADNTPAAPPPRPPVVPMTENPTGEGPAVVMVPIPGGQGETKDPAESVFEEILKSKGGSGPVTITTRGSAMGVLQWTGELGKGEVLFIDGPIASQGVLKGSLPGVPVGIEVDRQEFAVIEAPSAQNHWTRLAVSPLNRSQTKLKILWRAAQ